MRARGGDSFYVIGDAPLRSNMDFYSHYARNLLDLCFIPPETTDQVRWMNAWKALLEQSLRQPSGAFKVDGAAYHHGGHYHSYAQGTFANFAKFQKNLQDTPWRMSPQAHEQLRRAMLAQRLYANRFELPLSLTGRSPFWPGYGLILPYGVKALDALARLGSPDGKEPIDREVAAAYLRLAPEAAGKEPYLSQGIKPEPEPNGTFVMPGWRIGATTGSSVSGASADLVGEANGRPGAIATGFFKASAVSRFWPGENRSPPKRADATGRVGTGRVSRARPSRNSRWPISRRPGPRTAR